MSTTEHWWTVALIGLALLAIVPLALDLPDARPARITAALALASFALPPGLAAAALCLPWLAVMGLTALGRPRLPVCWAGAAGGWLLAHRAGLDPLDVGRGITLLTVAHFLVAGCGLSALMLAVHRRRDGRAGLVAVACLQVGMVTVAAGILLGGWLEPIGAAAIIVALSVHSVTAWGIDVRHRVLLRMSCVAWTSPMVLAFLWALRTHLPQPVVGSIATMLAHHGTVNAVLVVLAGLVAVRHPSPTQEAHRAPTVPTHA